MKSGRLRLRIQIVQPNLSRDSRGELEAPTVFATVWSSLTPLTSKYIEKAERVVTEATWKLGIRYLAGLTTAMHVLYDGRVFNIEAVMDPDGRKRELELHCYERNGRT